MLKYIEILIISLFLFLGCIAQNEPQNYDYLRVDFDNPQGSQPINHYVVYRFPSAIDTLNPIDSVLHPYNFDNDYHVYFDNLPVNDTIYFRVISENQYGRSDFSGPVKGLIDENFVPNSYVLTDTSVQIEWETRFPGAVTERWLKLVTEKDSLLSLDLDNYLFLGLNDSNQISVELTELTPNEIYYFFAFEVEQATGDCITGDLYSFFIDIMPPKVIIIRLLK